jgi:hypothetical protein
MARRLETQQLDGESCGFEPTKQAAKRPSEARRDVSKYVLG